MKRLLSIWNYLIGTAFDFERLPREIQLDIVLLASVSNRKSIPIIATVCKKWRAYISQIRREFLIEFSKTLIDIKHISVIFKHGSKRTIKLIIPDKIYRKGLLVPSATLIITDPTLSIIHHVLSIHRGQFTAIVQTLSNSPFIFIKGGIVAMPDNAYRNDYTIY
jgi:hypothetical protein